MISRLAMSCWSPFWLRRPSRPGGCAAGPVPDGQPESPSIWTVSGLFAIISMKGKELPRSIPMWIVMLLMLKLMKRVTRAAAWGRSCPLAEWIPPDEQVLLRLARIREGSSGSRPGTVQEPVHGVCDDGARGRVEAEVRDRCVHEQQDQGLLHGDGCCHIFPTSGYIFLPVALI